MIKTETKAREYDSPAIKTLQIIHEGVLCLSNGIDEGTSSINDWENDDDIINF